MPSLSRPWRRTDSAILATSLALGLLLAWEWQSHDTWDVEAVLGLYPTTAAVKAEIQQLRQEFEHNRRDHPSMRVELALWTSRIAESLPQVLSVLSLGSALATFRRPRSLGRRPLRRIGVLTTLLAAVLVLGICINEYLLRGVFQSILGPYLRMIFMFWNRLGTTIGFAILAAWIAAALSGTWRARNDAWDRLGLAIGGAWLLFLGYRQFISPLLG
jgi:hypothetical protein